MYLCLQFSNEYRCYPVPFIEKPQMENGDKIIMPPSALHHLEKAKNIKSSLHVSYPMLFELRNDAAERVSHCGVLEFIAEEGIIYMPYWMMESMVLQEGDTVRVKNVRLPKGTYVKLQPHTRDFLDISNPKAILCVRLNMPQILETTLRNFTCLTTGDTIMVAYNNKKYYIDIIETKPSNAITIIDTDCEVDFAPPLDHRKSTVEKDYREHKFIPFSGSGKRLDGKPMNSQFPSLFSSLNPNGNSLSSSASHSNARHSQGKVVFGSDVYRSNEIVKEKEPKRQPPQPKEPKFQAFMGKKYSLRS
ncbi:ubiquitin fusion degradation protein 1-like protein isoform X1 [Senna tora]|uniref:Ubiquitin fusion degradation protein 1-like protein isoform X1 n=1 Tax=Senna tora TaxID=362788 RepID=A0A834XDA2_9FABA|nr:ubiquitin fusion degradation protein 1-like protein isoform X1 [Senna tora]